MLLGRLAFGRLMAESIGDTHIHWDSNWWRDNEEAIKAECSLSDAEGWALQAIDWKVELPETAGSGQYFDDINAIEGGAGGTYTGYAAPRLGKSSPSADRRHRGSGAANSGGGGKTRRPAAPGSAG